MDATRPAEDTGASLPWLWIGALVVFALALGLRLWMAWAMVGPLGSDSSYYLLVARNLAQGRGFVDDVVWNFLSRPPALHHPSNDYWMPLESILIYLSQLILGKSFFAAQALNLLLGAGVPVVAIIIAREMGARRGFAVLAGILLAASQRQIYYSIDTDSAMSYAFFGGLAFLGTVRGLRGSRSWLAAAGIAAGLAHLSRNDGALWAPGMIAVFLLSRRDQENRAAPFRDWLGAGAGYLAVIGPWMIRNLSAFGTLLPPNSTRAIFFQRYMDLFAFDPHLSLQGYLGLGLAAIVKNKAHALLSALKMFAGRGALDPWLAPLAVLGVILTSSNCRRVIVIHLCLLIAAWSLVMDIYAGTTLGGTLRTAVGLMIYLVPAAMLGLDRAEQWLRWRQSYPAWMVPVLFLVVAGLMNVLDPAEYRRNDRIIAFSVRDWAYLNKLSQVLRSISPEPVTIMTFRPWQLNLAADLPSVSIPSDGLAALREACRKYQVDFLVLEKDRKYDKPEFQEVVAYLEKLASARELPSPGEDLSFIPYARLDNTWIFRVVRTVPPPPAGKGRIP